MTHSPRIVMTLGESAGIGPDILISLVQSALPVELIVIGDRHLLAQRASVLNLPLIIESFTQNQAPRLHKPGVIYIIDEPLSVPCDIGKPNPKNAASVLSCLARASKMCLEGQATAMVTGPVHKGVINDAGFHFSGQTEYLAKLTGAELPVMMLAYQQTRVALVTTHCPLIEVSRAVTKTRLRLTIQILHRALQKRFCISHPTIHVCGLNPHAGENGHLGMEEIEIIEPVILECRKNGMNVIGPFSADTAFVPNTINQADATLAMYHDQGLPVIKQLGFGHTVNITLGLPIIRTSVDHGVALSLAGSGKASTTSLSAAITQACQLHAAKESFQYAQTT